MTSEHNDMSQPPQGRTYSRQAISGLLLLSLLFGILGGICGAVYIARSPQLQRLSGLDNSQPLIQQGVYKEESAVIDVVKKAGPAVVSVVVSKDINQIQRNPLANDPFFAPFFGGSRQPSETPNIQPIGAGSGFFVTADGLLLTNRHVVADEQATYSVVTTDGTSYEARVVARDPINDLAIMKVEIKNAPTVPLSDSGELQVGQQVVAIGNSLGQYQNTVTSGIVSGIGRSITAGGPDGSEQLEGVIQTDAAINPGNSGGPLLNLAGQVIGINTAVDREGQLVGFAIASNDARRALESFQQLGRIARPFLGVRYVTITKSLAASEKLPRDYGALLIRGTSQNAPAVIPGSPAGKAGLVENDIILEINGSRLNEQNSLSKHMKNYKVGETVNLKIYHQGEEKTVTVTLEEIK